MLIHKENKPGFFPKSLRVAAIGLLAGCAWFATTSLALAQQRTDSAIQSDVTTAIGQDSALQGQQISATASKGVVTLTGTVQTDAQRQQAETDAANVTDVGGIINNLKVTNPGTPASQAGLAAQSSADQLNPQDQNQDQSQPQSQDQSQVQGQAPNTVPPPPPDQPQQQQPTYGSRPPYQGYQGYPQQQQQPYGYGYPPQQGYPPPQQSYAPPQVPYYPTPTSPVTIPAGTLLRVRLSEPLDTAHTKSGATFQATAAVDVYQGGVLAIPRGATLNGQIVESKDGGPFGGSATLRLQLTNVNLGGQIYPVSSDVWSNKGPNKAGYTAGNTVGGAVLGAIIGGIAGRGTGAAIGAGAGAAGGLAASAATTGPRLYLPAEATVDFHLTAPATVQPVSWQEAQRLASSAPSGPTLVQRPRPVYVVPSYYGPYPYAYPYPY
jgi:hypothetical protein